MDLHLLPPPSHLLQILQILLAVSNLFDEASNDVQVWIFLLRFLLELPL